MYLSVIITALAAAQFTSPVLAADILSCVSYRSGKSDFPLPDNSGTALACDAAKGQWQNCAYKVNSVCERCCQNMADQAAFKDKCNKNIVETNPKATGVQGWDDVNPDYLC